MEWSAEAMEGASEAAREAEGRLLGGAEDSSRGQGVAGQRAAESKEMRQRQ